jgi:hypothetical protein
VEKINKPDGWAKINIFFSLLSILLMFAFEY